MTKKINYNCKKLGQRLKKLRVAKKYTQEQLGNEIGATKQLISKIETGHRFASVDVLVQLSRLFKVPMEYLADVENHSKEYSNQTLAKELGLSDKVINEFRDRQYIGITYINAINNIFEVGYGWKFLLCLQDYLNTDFKSRADKKGEYRIIGKDKVNKNTKTVVTGEMLDDVAELRLHKILNQIKQKIKEKGYDFDYISCTPKNRNKVVKLLQTDNDIEETNFDEFLEQDDFSECFGEIIKNINDNLNKNKS